MSTIVELREWLMFVAEWIIVYILIIEYKYDKEKDDLKKQKKTKTTKKTTTRPGGDTVVEETTEETSPLTQGEMK